MYMNIEANNLSQIPGQCFLVFSIHFLLFSGDENDTPSFDCKGTQGSEWEKSCEK